MAIKTNTRRDRPGRVTDREFEQYKLFVETAEEVSRKRLTTNGFFFALNTALLGIVVHQNGNRTAIAAMFFGLISSIIWVRLLTTYRKLNKIKYDMILDIEKNLPHKLFTEEYNHIKAHKLSRFSTTEATVAYLFAITFVAILLVSL